MTVETTNNTAESRYEIAVDGRVVGVADYYFAGDDRIVFPHTEIARPLRGRGLGAELVGAALDDVRATKRKVVPLCWYVAQFIDEHPEYESLRAS